MKKLQCEICGGSLMMQDGIAVCESCGMKFSKEEVKKMVVELSGPIEIKGPVELIKGEEEKNRLLEDAERLIKAGAADEAAKLFRRVTEEYPTEYRGWFGCWRCGAITGIAAPELTFLDVTLHDKKLAPIYSGTEIQQTPVKRYADICFPTTFEREYEIALSLVSEEEKERLRQYRETNYDKRRRAQEDYDTKIHEYVKESDRNALELRLLGRKYNYTRCFREVMLEHCGSPVAIPYFGPDVVYGYLGNWISFCKDSPEACYAEIDIPSERMGELEQMALDKYNSYLKQHRCPLCEDHPKLDLLGRCKNAKNYSFHDSLKPLKKTD